MIRILVLNGPNLNLLGQREPELYGGASLADLELLLRQRAEQLGVTVSFAQSNHEGELIDWVHTAGERADALIVNLGGYSHTSVALRDAFLAVPLPFIEVHITNLFRREATRHHSLIADLAIGMITGLGIQGYRLALDALAARLADD